MMDDFIKEHIKNYKPEFKEAHWIEASKMLKKKRRKRAIIFWFSGVLGLLIVGYGLSLMLSPKESPITNKAMAAVETDKNSITNASNDNYPLATTNQSQSTVATLNNKSTTAATATNDNRLNAPRNETSIAKTSRQENQSTDPAIMSNSVSKSTTIKGNNAIAENIDKNVTTKTNTATNNSNLSNQRSDDDKHLAYTPTTNPVEIPEEYQQTSSNSKPTTEGATETPAQPQYFAAAALPLQDISLFDRDALIPAKVSEKEIVVKDVKKPLAFAPHFAVQVVALMYQGQQKQRLQEYTVQVEYRKALGRNLFAAAGLGAGMYHGDFSSMQSEKRTFGNFVKNDITHTMSPSSMFYVSAPIRLGYHVKNTNFGIIASPSYTYAAYGTYHTVENNRTIVTESSSAYRYGVDTKSKETNQKSWLATDNLHAVHLPIGLFIEQELTSSLRVGIAANYQTSRFMKLKNAIDNRDQAFSSSNLVNGGLYVAYEF